MIFEKAWRWFGETDPVSLDYLRQMGVESVVTAVHSRRPGESWSVEDIAGIRQQIETAGMKWQVVESLPVPEGIKLHNNAYDELLCNYLESMKRLASEGIHTICYNFMPVLDWVRTDLSYQLPDGGIVMKFDPVTFAAFDIFILQREKAETSYDSQTRELAESQYLMMSPEQREELAYNIIVRTQGFINGNVSDSADFKGYFLSLIRRYEGIDEEVLRKNLLRFLADILPTAESLGISLAIHPDDPPWPVLGLPRIVKNLDDLNAIFSSQPSSSNGLTFCSGSLSAADQNIQEIAGKFADRIKFLHLRNTERSGSGDFHETGHLSGDLDMVELIQTIISSELLPEDRRIPVRPDHGPAILDDAVRDSAPGYPLYGRLVGLTEIFSIEKTLRWKMNQGHS